jgi:hypothetical protein
MKHWTQHLVRQDKHGPLQYARLVKRAGRRLHADYVIHDFLRLTTGGKQATDEQLTDRTNGHHKVPETRVSWIVLKSRRNRVHKMALLGVDGVTIDNFICCVLHLFYGLFKWTRPCGPAQAPIRYSLLLPTHPASSSI